MVGARLVAIAIHLGLLSATIGAAVDAPRTATEVPEVKEDGERGVSKAAAGSEEEGGHRIVARSVPDYQDSIDYPKLAYGAADTGSRSRRRYSEGEWGSWSLPAQVAKRGARRGGEQWRGRGDLPGDEEVKLVENSLAAAQAGAATTMLARQQRNGRRYDVPQIGQWWIGDKCRYKYQHKFLYKSQKTQCWEG